MAQGFHVRFPDLPEALTGGADLPDTLEQASDCLAEALAGRIARGDAIPTASRLKRGQYPITVPLYLAPKQALYLAMREGGLRNTDLAKRIGVSETARWRHSAKGSWSALTSAGSDHRVARPIRVRPIR
jgi:antitoxin HicB